MRRANGTVLIFIIYHCWDDNDDDDYMRRTLTLNRLILIANNCSTIVVFSLPYFQYLYLLGKHICMWRTIHAYKIIIKIILYAASLMLLLLNKTAFTHFRGLVAICEYCQHDTLRSHKLENFMVHFSRESQTIGIVYILQLSLFKCTKYVAFLMQAVARCALLHLREKLLNSKLWYLMSWQCVSVAQYGGG